MLDVIWTKDEEIVEMLSLNLLMTVNKTSTVAEIKRGGKLWYLHS